MAPLINPSEIQLLKKEIEAQGEFLSSERLERKAEIDQLKIELESITRTLDRMVAGFQPVFKQMKAEMIQSFDPEHPHAVIPRKRDAA